MTTLSATGEASGKQFTTAAEDDLGRFAVDVEGTGPVSIEGTGIYYDEVGAGLSSSAITLRAYSEVTQGGDETIHVNALTHLSYARVTGLLQGGASVSEATSQAEGELRAGLGIGAADLDPGPAVDLDLLAGDTDANAYLFAVSATLLQAAHEAAGTDGSVDAELQQLMDTIASGLAESGEVDGATRERLHRASLTVHATEVEESLGRRYAELGSPAVVPDLGRVLPNYDLDGDGYLSGCDVSDLCDDCDDTDPNAAGATDWYVDVDGDGYGGGEPIASCESVPGRITTGGDCADGDAARHPGASEYTDGVDSDCDGVDAACGSSALRVPLDYATVQAAIDVACDGDTIEVSAGTYVENIDLGTKVLNLLGVDGREATILDGGRNGTVVRMAGGFIRGFTIANGLVPTIGGGVRISSDLAPITIEDCIIRDNEAFSEGGGIAVEVPTDVTVRSTLIAFNESASGGAAYSEGGITFEDCELTGSTAYQSVLDLRGDASAFHLWLHDNEGTGIMLGGGGDGTFLLEDSVIERQVAGALIADGALNATIRRTLISGNGDGGLYFYSTTEVTLESVTVVGNQTTAGDFRSGIYVDAVNSHLRGVQVIDNVHIDASLPAVEIERRGDADGLYIAGNNGAGLRLTTWTPSNPQTVTNATIVGNAGNGIEMSPVWDDLVQLRNVVVADNTGIGLVNAGAYQPVISYGDLFGNGQAVSGMPTPSATSGNLTVDPAFVSFSAATPGSTWDLHLAPASPLINSGDPAILDVDGSRSDMGAYGGPSGDF